MISRKTKFIVLTLCLVLCISTVVYGATYTSNINYASTSAKGTLITDFDWSAFGKDEITSTIIRTSGTNRIGMSLQTKVTDSATHIVTKFAEVDKNALQFNLQYDDIISTTIHYYIANSSLSTIYKDVSKTVKE